MRGNEPCESIDFRDSEELSLALRHTDVSAMQINRGRFHARLRQSNIENWSLQSVSFIEGMATCTGSAAPDRHAFLIPLTVGSGCRLLGGELTLTSIGVYSPHSEHADVSAAGCDEVVVMPPADMLALAIESGERLHLPSRGSELRLAPALELEQLRQLLQELASVDTPRLMETQLTRAMVDALKMTLLPVLSSASSASERGRTRLPRSAVLRRVSEVMKERDGDVLYASELAEIADVSYPTLQRIFQEWFGTSPLRYLLLKRLYLARQMLRSGTCASVSDVATSCGFWELSRFAQRYRSQFGELPSQALRRDRSLLE